MENGLPAFVEEHAKRDDPQSVLDAFDQFALTTPHGRMMHVGAKKGTVLDENVKRALQEAPFDADKGHIFIEMGTYCGYSATRIARLLKAANKKTKLYTFDVDERVQQIAKQLVHFAGLSDYVHFVHGPLSEKLEAIMKAEGVKKVDFIFIDHGKSAYVPDFKLVEQLSLFRKGTLVLADNILFPGVPEYQEYLMKHASFRSELIKVALGGKKEDGVLVSECTV